MATSGFAFLFPLGVAGATELPGELMCVTSGLELLKASAGPSERPSLCYRDSISLGGGVEMRQHRAPVVVDAQGEKAMWM